MPMHDYVLPAQTSLRQAPEAPFANCAASLGSLIGDWLATAADDYTAAAVYEQLSRLSDAELQRRGLSRATQRSVPAATSSRDATSPPGSAFQAGVHRLDHDRHLGGVCQRPQPQSVCSLDQSDMRGRSNTQQKIAADNRCPSCVQGGLSTF